MIFQSLIFVFFSFFIQVFSQSYNDVICRRPWYFNSPNPAPLRCPTPGFFSFYECCGEFRENCCWRIRQEPIYVLIICLVILICLCCCCCLAWFISSLRNNKQKTREIEKVPKKKKYRDEEIQTISRSVDSGTQSDFVRLKADDPEFERRRSYAAARDQSIDYHFFT